MNHEIQVKEACAKDNWAVSVQYGQDFRGHIAVMLHGGSDSEHIESVGATRKEALASMRTTLMELHTSHLDALMRAEKEAYEHEHFLRQEYYLQRESWIQTSIQGLYVLFSEDIPIYARLYENFEADFEPRAEIQGAINTLVGPKYYLLGWDWTGDVFGGGSYYSKILESIR